MIQQRGKRPIAQNYTPTLSPVNEFKTYITIAFRQRYKGPPLEGPIRLRVRFVMPRPKSMNRKRTPNRRRWFARRPDWDNLGKVTDALNGIAWRDDAQIVQASVTKLYASDKEVPHAEFEITQITEPPKDPHYGEDQSDGEKRTG